MTTRELKAAVSYGPDQPLSLETLEVPGVGPSEILVEVEYAGVCHTDLGCHQGKIHTNKPIVLGHEGAGTVLEVGVDVRSVRVGAKVLMSFMSCGACPSCRRGTTSYCHNSLKVNMLGGGLDGMRRYPGSPVYSHYFGQSSFATHAVASVRNVVVVPDDTPLHFAAPFGCGVQTGAGTVFNSLRVRPGSSITVFGAGAVGLSATMAARIAGAYPIVVCDVVPARLDLARELGADVVIDANDPDVVDRIKAATGGGSDFCVEASGNAVALRNAVDVLEHGGICASVGATNVDIPIDARALRIKGASLRGVIEGDANPTFLLPYLLGEFRRGRLPVDRMVRLYDFGDINTAFEDAESGRTVKPVLAIKGSPDT